MPAAAAGAAAWPPDGVVSAVKRAARTARPTRPVAPATRIAAIAATSTVAATITATTTATAAAHAVYAGAHRVRLSTGRVARVAVAGVAVARVCTQVGICAWGLRIVIAIAAAATFITTATGATACRGLATGACTAALATTTGTTSTATTWTIAAAIRCGTATGAPATATAAIATTGRAGAALAAAIASALAGLVGANAFHHFAAGGLGGCLHHVTARGLACAAPDGLAAHGDGFGLFTCIGAKAFNDLHGDLLLGEALDLHHEAFFVHADQAHGFARCACAAGAANAVHVVFQIGRAHV